MIRIIAIVAVGAFIAGSAGGWIAHSTWTDARKTDRLEAAIRKAREDTRRQVKAEYEERLQKRHDAGISQKAADAAQEVDWTGCPALPSGYVRLLNDIGTRPSASEPAHEVPGEAGTP